MPDVPAVPFFTLAPDWMCEVLSPSTVRVDRVRKARIFARERVAHRWFVDLQAHALALKRIDGATYRDVLVVEDADKVRAEPFDATRLDIAILWPR